MEEYVGQGQRSGSKVRVMRSKNVHWDIPLTSDKIVQMDLPKKKLRNTTWGVFKSYAFFLFILSFHTVWLPSWLPIRLDSWFFHIYSCLCRSFTVWTLHTCTIYTCTSLCLCKLSIEKRGLHCTCCNYKVMKSLTLWMSLCARTGSWLHYMALYHEIMFIQQYIISGVETPYKEL